MVLTELLNCEFTAECQVLTDLLNLKNLNYYVAEEGLPDQW